MELVEAARRRHPGVRFENLDLNALDASPLCLVDGHVGQVRRGVLSQLEPRLRLIDPDTTPADSFVRAVTELQRLIGLGRPSRRSKDDEGVSGQRL